MSISSQLVALVLDIGGRIDLPPIRYLYVPAFQPDPDKDAEFGLIGLADGSTGFFYAWLDDTQDRLQQALPELQRLVGSDPVSIAGLFNSADRLDRTVGLGAIGAISQHIFKVTGYALNTTTDSMGKQVFLPDDHVGLVGLFPSLVERLRRRGVALTVIEKKSELVQREGNYEVTLDPAKLSTCNKVLSTASVLLNDTLDEILSHCAHAEQVTIIGPSAGCLPDPLFKRGVDAIGGSVVTDLDGLLERLKNNLPWGNSVQKYVISRTEYPGVYKLLNMLRNL